LEAQCKGHLPQFLLKTKLKHNQWLPLLRKSQSQKYLRRNNRRMKKKNTMMTRKEKMKDQELMFE
jgi:hypothetical protein